MLRALVLVLALAANGCGDDTTAAAALDLSTPTFDLSTPGQHCGGVVCTGGCTVCVQLGGGLCAIPCKTAMPSTCSSGVCNPAVPDGGNGGGVTFGGDCAGYNGFCG